MSSWESLENTTTAPLDSFNLETVVAFGESECIATSVEHGGVPPRGPVTVSLSTVPRAWPYDPNYTEPETRGSHRSANLEDGRNRLVGDSYYQGAEARERGVRHDLQVARDLHSHACPAAMVDGDVLRLSSDELTAISRPLLSLCSERPGQSNRKHRQYQSCAVRSNHSVDPSLDLTANWGSFAFSGARNSSRSVCSAFPVHPRKRTCRPASIRSGNRCKHGSNEAAARLRSSVLLQVLPGLLVVFREPPHLTSSPAPSPDIVQPLSASSSRRCSAYYAAMNRVLEPPSRNPFTRPVEMSTEPRTIPVLSASISPSDPGPGDPMDVSPPASATMGPPSQSSPEIDHGPGSHTNGNTGDSASSQNPAGQPTGAAAAAQQPKVVQTAFIHKLYSSNESFVMSPSSDFSKVLAYVTLLDPSESNGPIVLKHSAHTSQYFKHTNISSFVRQLNMYGFHKVSDVFHTGSPDSPMWEFRHGNGNFRKGDLSGLREIKRRASRHALIHRDSFSTHKNNNASQPGTPAEAVPEAPDRMANLEHSLYEVHSRLSRMEDQHALLSSRCQALTESLIRCHQWANSMSHFITSLVPDSDNVIHREAVNMQREVARQLDVVRALELPNDMYMPGQQPYFANLTVDTGPPLSPRQVAQDSRRTSIARPPMPPHISISPHRYGSMGGPNNAPNYNRPQAAPQPPPPHPPHPLSVSSPPGANLGRRHTSADIRQLAWPHLFLRPTESLPATRRSSMASNVHSLLNPAETRERAEEEEAAAIEDRKRQRLQ
ncbi:predicted protein [Uncinocarpus reesii 1704]|uniref:HSF-type DNA-binding domain-containing protein n=1 Tax=Uncinocarpus reesii (strain UAMH 1704) TaxID=336963 RepID=C4JGU9_UNCRE|nr:uncharacterized protein UREG_02611 [Uncinocarpus reesii 1704]EEP77762.1 predicted protein [Uncinocarpus reesii 1704]